MLPLVSTCSIRSDSNSNDIYTFWKGDSLGDYILLSPSKADSFVSINCKNMDMKSIFKLNGNERNGWFIQFEQDKGYIICDDKNDKYQVSRAMMIDKDGEIICNDKFIIDNKSYRNNVSLGLNHESSFFTINDFINRL